MELSIDRQRMARELETLGEISEAPPPVVTRVVYTEADVRGREFVKSLCREAGLPCVDDPAGNTFARWTGEDPEPRSSRNRLARRRDSECRPLRRNGRRAGRSRSDSGFAARWFSS